MAVAFVCFGLLVRLGDDPEGWRAFSMLGAWVGVGCWTKGVFFPLGLMMLGAAAWSAGGRRRVVRGAVAATAAWVVVAGPLVGALSAKQGRLTWGEVGRLNYSWSLLSGR